MRGGRPDVGRMRLQEFDAAIGRAIANARIILGQLDAQPDDYALDGRHVAPARERKKRQRDPVHDYDLAAHRLVGGLLGFQYATDCWAVSVALQKYTNHNGTTSPTTGTRVLVQLRLDGLNRIDNGLLQKFRANVPGYSTPTLPAPTSRFTDYS